MAERRDEGFLARWARRKHAARAAAREHEPQHDAATQVATRPADADAGAAAADATPALPDPATLDASSDFSAFLGKEVPVETQRAALRRLWRLDPIYNRMDGLDDYCADFTGGATVLRGLRTAYTVGRGMLEHAAEREAPSDEAPASQQPGNEAERLAAGSDVPTPPEDPAPAMPPAAEGAPQRAEPGRFDPRRPRPLPKRG
jgi:Protein of unknown function (DUF3306)